MPMLTLHPILVINYKTEDGISHNIIYNIFNDQAGSLWFATAKGITRYYKGKFKVYNETNGLAGNIVLYILSLHP